MAARFGRRLVRLSPPTQGSCAVPSAIVFGLNPAVRPIRDFSSRFHTASAASSHRASVGRRRSHSAASLFPSSFHLTCSRPSSSSIHSRSAHRLWSLARPLARLLVAAASHHHASRTHSWRVSLATPAVAHQSLAEFIRTHSWRPIAITSSHEPSRLSLLVSLPRVPRPWIKVGCNNPWLLPRRRGFSIGLALPT